MTEADIGRFLETQADFAFEMRVLSALHSLGFECQHAGTFRDPITDKIRQFDIRARRNAGPYHLRLAVECKNLRDARPLLLHAVPRREAEAYHDLIVRKQPPQANTQTRSIRGYESAYKPREFVAKRTDQVSRTQDGGFKSSDTEVFEKISQAVNSLHDLIRNSVYQIMPHQAHAIIPMLVVPDGTIWQVDYGEDGSVVASPRQVSSATLFLDNTWVIQTASITSYSISHLEIVALGSLKERTEYLAGPEGVFALEDSLLALT
jgi:hypothetical protein